MFILRIIDCFIGVVNAIPWLIVNLDKFMVDIKLTLGYTN